MEEKIEYPDMIIKWRNKKTGKISKTSLLRVLPDFKPLATFFKIYGGEQNVELIECWGYNHDMSAKQNQAISPDELLDKMHSAYDQ